MPFDVKGVYFGFVYASQSRSTSFTFFKMTKRVDVVNVRGKSAKKLRTTSLIFSSPLKAPIMPELYALE